jgi:type IV pilus assembly protein PilA
MHNALRKRFDKDSEEGFTLIELMVVVLIIGILLAIAIPTFLGARNRANNRSAQSNLRNGLTAEKTLFTDNQTYQDTASASDIAALSAVEPSLNWVAASTSQVTGSVSATIPVSGNPGVILATKSATGECFYIGDVSLPSSPNTAGTFYASSNATTCVPPTTLPNSLPTAGSQTNGTGSTWATSFGV